VRFSGGRDGWRAVGGDRFARARRGKFEEKSKNLDKGGQTGRQAGRAGRQAGRARGRAGRAGGRTWATPAAWGMATSWPTAAEAVAALSLATMT
jgi:hypothetical protein